MVIVRDRSCPTREYLEALTETDRKKVWALLQRTSQYGPPRNDQKFKKLIGPIMEFKSYQDRLLCFFAGPRRIVITHGCKKKRDRASPEDIKRSEQLMGEYLESRTERGN
jgi:phage-related protein